MVYQEVSEKCLTTDKIKNYLSFKCECYEKSIKKIKQYQTPDSIIRIFQVNHDLYQVITDKADAYCKDIVEISKEEFQIMLKNLKG